MSGLPPPPGGLGGLPPPPGGMGGLPPPPGMGGLPPPPSGMGGLPPPPMSTGLGSNRGIPPPLGTGLPPPGGAPTGLPPPPSGMGGLPPPPASQFGSGRGLSTGLPPPPSSSGSGLPPPPPMGGLPPSPSGTTGGLPPPLGAPGGFPPLPGGSSSGLPPPPTSSFNSGRGLGTTLPAPPGSSSGLPPPPGGAGLPPPPGGAGLPPPPQQSGGLPPPPMSTGLNSSKGIAPLGTGLPPPSTGGLPPPPGGSGLPPPPMSSFASGRMPPPGATLPPPGAGMPPPPISNFQSGRVPFTAGGIPSPPASAAPPGFASPVAPPPTMNSMNFQTQMAYQSNMGPPPQMATMGPPRMVPPAPQMQKDDLGPETSLLKTCKECSKPCKDKYIFAFGNCYCPGCLKCEMPTCQKPITPPECLMWKEKPICFQCAKVNGKLQRCPVCQEFLINHEEIITLKDLNLTIHADCLRCVECSAKLLPSNYNVIKDQICCESCKHLAQQRACRECQEPILGRFIFDRSHYFHIDCFKCSECDKRLNGKNFVVHHNRYYCPEQGIRYLKSCSYCKTEISLTELSKIRWQNKWFHKRCFVCRVCGCLLETKDAFCCHNRPHCRRCFEQRVKDGDVTDSGRTPSNHEHEHKPEVSRQQRERFKKKFGDDKFRMPRYANEEEAQDKDDHKSKHSSRKGSDSGHKSKRGSDSGHKSHRGHESHRGHKEESSSSSRSSESDSSSSSDHHKSHRSHRSKR